MVLDSVARIVKVQLPAYLKQLPVPDSITGFARLTGNPDAAVPSARAAPWGGAAESAGRGPGPRHVTRDRFAPARRGAAADGVSSFQVNREEKVLS